MITSNGHLLWEQHTCLPMHPGGAVDDLARYRRSGGAYVSANVGYSPHDADQVRALVENYRSQVDRIPWLSFAATIDDVDEVVGTDRVAVGFDLEDSGPLAGDLDLVEHFYELGVRSMIPTYNRANMAGGGCLDENDGGLTGYGRDLVHRMNEVGMMVDATHCGARTALEMCEVSEKPVIYSHSGACGVWDHPRNITDDQIRECARTGGVVGLPGVGVFLGPNTATLAALIAHLEYIIDLVGVEHVGIGTDFVFGLDLAEFTRIVKANPQTFPGIDDVDGVLEFITPEVLSELEGELMARGYPTEAIGAILGGNFRRVARDVWSSPRSGSTGNRSV